MSYKIIGDSCCELPKKYWEEAQFELVPLGLEIGEYRIQDDENFDQLDYIKRIAESNICAKSSCPSPERYVEACAAEVDNIYIITLSSALSGSYNSAALAKNLIEAKGKKKNIHVLDSLGASATEVKIAMKIMDLEREGISFDKIVAEIEQYRDNIRTHFVLDNLDTLRKNGRLVGVRSVVASTLSIKPVMCAVDGSIAQLGQGMGINQALKKMVAFILENKEDTSNERIIITHCNCIKRANFVIKLLTENHKFKEIITLEAGGIATTYANNGGIIVAL